MNTINYINEKLNSAKELDFGTIFNEAIELFKKTWVHGMLAQLFIIIIMLPFIIMIYVPLIALVIAQEQSGGYASSDMDSVFAGFSVLYILFILFILILLSTIAGAIGAGLYRVIKKVDLGEVVVTRDLFYYLKVNYVGKLLGIMAISILIAIPSALLCYIPLIYMMVPLSLFSPVFAFNSHFSVGEIVSTSFKLGTKKWLLLFGLILISSLLAQIIGMLACGIGVLVTAPFVYHPVYLVYKKVVGFGNEEEALDLKKNEY